MFGSSVHTKQLESQAKIMPEMWHIDHVLSQDGRTLSGRVKVFCVYGPKKE